MPTPRVLQCRSCLKVLGFVSSILPKLVMDTGTMKKMAAQTVDVMEALLFLKPNIQQVHQYDWSSGHKKNKEGGLATSSVNFYYGGKGGVSLCDTDLSEDLVGDDYVPGMMYESISEGVRSVWSLKLPYVKEGVVVKVHDCRVRAGNTQSMPFATAEENPPPPVYALEALWYDQPDLDAQGVQKKTKKLAN